MLPLPTHKPLLEKLDPATLFYFLALQTQYWADSNSIPFHMGLSSIHTEVSGQGAGLEELTVCRGRYGTAKTTLLSQCKSRSHRKYRNTEKGAPNCIWGIWEDIEEVATDPRLERSRGAGLMGDLEMVTVAEGSECEKTIWGTEKGSCD